MNIYVGNLSFDTTEQDLRQAFETFGQVTSGMEAVDAIVGAKRDRADKPLVPQVITAIRVDTKGADYPFERL